ncbi:MAG: hypothetical protein HKL96_12865 [Phycisphaerales bacterium]|nr:hypothetical protein [Phycisphaerales bacterium]
MARSLYDDDDAPDALEFQRYQHNGVKCNHCGKLVFDDLDECPFCHAMVSTANRKSRWLIWTAAGLLLLFLFALLQGLGLI